MRSVLVRMARAGHAPLHTRSPQDARIAYQAGADVLEVPKATLPRVEDFHIPARDGAALSARLYAPTARHQTAPLPLLLYLHGGGFTIGSIATHDILCRELARLAGCMVVSLDYRLAPEHRFPTASHDAWDALLWLSENASTLGADATRLAVGGDSAGGTLAASTALLARDAGIPLVLQALFYPSVQLGMKTDSLLTYSANTLLSWDLMHWFETNARGGELRQRWHREPLHAPDHRGVAPAWIGLAECDPLTDEGKLYAQKLKDAGVPTELTVWPGVIHDFINLGRFIPEAEQAHQQLAAALKRAYGG